MPCGLEQGSQVRAQDPLLEQSPQASAATSAKAGIQARIKSRRT